MHVVDLTANYSNMHLFNFSKCFDLIMFNKNDKTGPSGENHRLIHSFSSFTEHVIVMGHIMRRCTKTRDSNFSALYLNVQNPQLTSVFKKKKKI